MLVSWLLAKSKLDIYHSPLMNTDKNLQPWKHQGNEISLSNTDPVSTSVQNPQPLPYDSDKEHFKTQNWFESLESISKLWGERTQAWFTGLFPPNPLVSSTSLQTNVHKMLFRSSVPKARLRYMFRLLLFFQKFFQPYFHFLFTCKFE